jgi:hypothetical protein
VFAWVVKGGREEDAIMREDEMKHCLSHQQSKRVEADSLTVVGMMMLLLLLLLGLSVDAAASDQRDEIGDRDHPSQVGGWKVKNPQ